MSLNNENSNLTPGVRSKGFTDDWEQRKLSEIYDKIRNAFVGTATPYYVNQGHFYLESNNVKYGKLNFNNEVYINDDFYQKQKPNWLHTGDLVVVQSGHVGHSAVIPSELNNTAAHAVIIVAKPKQKIDPYFINDYLQTNIARKQIDNITTGNTIKHILASAMKMFEVSLPSYEEQRPISNLLAQIDDTIALHQRKYDNLRQALHWTQQNLLPEPDSSLPKVRVGKFESDWTLQPLSEIIKKNNERNKGQFPVESTLSIATMRYKPEGNGAVQSSLDGYKVCRIGDIAFEGHTNDTFQYGRFILNLTGDGIISPRFTSFRFKHQDQVDIRYWKRFLHYEPVIHRILAHSTKLGTMMNEIMPDFLLKQLLSVPSLAEQQAIARVFTKLEERIQSEQALIENLKLVKKWALDNMFV
jgi:type I restriction enzyme S subunit